MEDPLTLQVALQDWSGTEAPLARAEVTGSPGYAAMRPAARVQALNQTQRNWANWMREKAPDYGQPYGDIVRDIERDFSAERSAAVEDALAADLAAGKFTDAQIKDYTTGRVSLADYPEPQDLAGPWVTQKLPVSNGFVYVRHDPGLSEETIMGALSPVRTAGDTDMVYPQYQYGGDKDRVEVAWEFRGNDNQPIKGVDDVAVGKLFADVATGESHYGPLYGQNPSEKKAASLRSVPAALRPAMAATEIFSEMARQRPELSDKIGQGFWQGLPGEAAKGFLQLGAAAVHAPAALTGSKGAVADWQQGQQEIEADIEGQSRLAFRGALTDKILKGISAEVIPMAFSMGTGALAASVRGAVSSAVGKGFVGRMAAMEMEQAAKQGLTGLTREAAAKMIAAELTGEGVGTTARQGLATSLSRGLFGKWLGTAEIQGPLARQLADRVTNAVAFLPSSARSGLDNMATTLNKAEALRATGDEAGAQALERSAVVNGWAGLGIETLSENIWLNEMLVTRAGRSLSRISTDVLERQLSPGRVAALASRGKEFLKQFAIQGNEEGIEEVVAGVGNRAFMNEFAQQNQDLFADIAPEYLTGAVLGGLMGGAKSLQQDGKPEAFRALVMRGLDGDLGAMASLARIRQKAEAAAIAPATAVTTSPDQNVTPASGSVTRLANLAGNVPPPIEGDATEAPAGDMDPQLVDMPPPPETISPGDAVVPADPLTTENPVEEVNNTDPMPPVPAAGPENTLFPEDTTPVPAVDPASETAAPDATPPTAPAPPAADPGNILTAPQSAPEPIEVRAQRAADPAARAHKAVLIPPGTPRPGKIPGLVAFQGDSPHGLVLYNPKKITPAEVRKAAQGATFDTRILGDTGNLTPPAAPDTVPASPQPVAQPAAEQGAGRRGKAGQPPAPAPGQPARIRKPGPRFQKDAERFPTISGMIGAGVKPPPPHRFLAAKRKEDKAGLRITPGDQAALDKVRGYEDMPTIGQYKGRPKAQDAIRQMYRAGSGNTVDQAFDQALGQSDEGTAERIRRLHQELASLDGPTPAADINEADYSTEERQNGEFYAAIEQGMIRLETGALKAGDILDIEGERVVVARVNTGRDGTVESVVLQDGRRFGKQIVDADVALFVEGYDPADGPPVTLETQTDADITAEQQRAAAAAKDKAARDAMAARQAAGLSGRDTTGQGALFADDPANDLFSGPSAEAQTFASDEDNNPFSRAAGLHPQNPTGIPAKAGAEALAALASNAPELVRNVRLVRSPGELEPTNYSPAAWSALADPQVEGFYNTRTGETILFTDHIGRRPGETPIGAVARVILHERLAHAGLAALRASDPAFAREWAALTDLIPAEELAALLPAYPHLAEDPARLAEEWFARRAEAARIAPPGSLLRRMWEAIKRALAKVWNGLKPGGMTLDDRVAEMLYQSRKALRSGSPAGTGTAPEIQESRNPLEPRDWASVPIPASLAAKLGATAPAPYKVQEQGWRAILTGSKLPAEFAKIAAQTQEEIRAVTDRGATLSRDLQAAMTAYATRSGQTPQQVADTVNAAMEDPLLMGLMADPVLKTRAIAARNFVDALSAEIAATTGGTLASTIRGNAGSWLRRGYAVFDSAAGWNGDTIRDAADKGKQIAGRDARTILANARAYLKAAHPKEQPAGIEAMISDLTNRDAWQSGVLGIPRPDGTRVSREVTSFMARKDIPAPIRALMGEERNPIARLSRSIGIQAQLIARFDQQRAMRDLGLSMGIFRTTADGTWHKPVGGTDADGNMRWNGFAWTDPATGKTKPVYTTPEMIAALDTAATPDGRDLGGMVLRAYKALGAEAKMNKVALNPDSWAVNILGNIIGLVQSGDTFHFAGWQRIAEAVRLHNSAGANSGDAVNAVAESIREVQRALVGRMAAAGVANASFDMQDLQASLDNSVLAFIEGSPVVNRAAGVARGAIVGQSLGRAFGPGVGQAIGGAVGAVAGGVVGGKAISAVQQKIARAVLSTPDNIGKIAVFLGNYASQLSAGMADADAFRVAAEKTRNTMPDYAKLPHLLRELSKLGVLGSFIAFQHEVYRNYYWNVRYAIQELRSGNKALVMRGLRRMLGTATVTALGGGLLSTIAGAFGAGADDDKDAAYRRSLGAPWERFGELAYTHLDNKSASFFNTSYIVPQTTLFEIYRAASEGKTFEDGLGNALTAARRQFAGGSVHADPVLEAIMNTRISGGPVTYEEGARGYLERLAHVVKVSVEPGATGKAERIGHALRGEEIRSRKFSLQEEALRMVGVRQSTYQHDDRMKNRLYEIRDTLADARSAAKKAWKDTPQPADRERAIARANERIAAAETRYREFEADMKTLGIPASRVANIRKSVGLSPAFQALQPGKSGPEPIRR